MGTALVLIVMGAAVTVGGFVLLRRATDRRSRAVLVVFVGVAALAAGLVVRASGAKRPNDCDANQDHRTSYAKTHCLTPADPGNN